MFTQKGILYVSLHVSRISGIATVILRAVDYEKSDKVKQTNCKLIYQLPSQDQIVLLFTPNAVKYPSNADMDYTH